MHNIGRFVEVIKYWDRALTINPSFGMARGNRGYGIVYYASLFEHLCHQVPFLKRAYGNLKAALSSKFEGKAGEMFAEALASVRSRAPAGKFEESGDEPRPPSFGKTKGEIKYRQWCLENRLFLNPLNDLVTNGMAAKDILTTPSIVQPIDAGTLYFGYFNQMKQEFVSARFFYYEGISADRPHYSDRGVLL
jgi:hypothetical protein